MSAMIKQGIVQETLADLNAPGGALPPLNNLPQWSRVNTLDRARYPKPFLKDRLQPLPNTNMSSPEDDALDQPSQESSDVEIDADAEATPSARVTHLEKSLQFLQEQHKQVLVNLHDEIEHLKQENKDLQFQIIMAHKGTPIASIDNSPVTSGKGQRSSKSGKRKSNQHTAALRREKSEIGKSQLPDPQAEENSHNLNKGTEEKEDELKAIFMEEELKDLKKKLRDEKNRNVYLAQLLEQTQKQQVEAVQAAVAEAQQEAPSVVKSATVPPAERDQGPDSMAHSATGPRYIKGKQIPFDVSVEPLLVHISPQVSRKPTLGECEIIIKNLQRNNDKQAHELTQLKSDLRDVLYSHKWTPDAYLLAKAYVAEDDAREQAERERLPRIQMKPANKKVPGTGYHTRDRVQLPELRNKIGNTSVERRKHSKPVW